MSYNYLLELYKALDARVLEINANKTGGTSIDHHSQGQLDTLGEFKKFIYDHYNHKLPRRLQK